MRPNIHFPTVDDELVRLTAYAIDAGHLKLATWGTKQDLIAFKETGKDRFRDNP